MSAWLATAAAGLVADNGLPINSDLLILLIFAAVSVIGGLLQKWKGEKRQSEPRRPGRPPQRTPQRSPDGSITTAPPRQSPARPPAPRPPTEPARPAPTPPVARPAPPPTPHRPRPVRPAEEATFDLDAVRERQERARRAEAERARRAAGAAPRAVPTTPAAIEKEAEIEDIEALPPLGMERPAARPGAVAPTLAREVADPLHRMLADRAGLQAGFLLSEILAPPLALRARHLQ